jgi:DNA polymerase sigma
MQASFKVTQWLHQTEFEGLLRPLVLIWKRWLAATGFNVVHQRGLGGFTLILLVVFALQDFRFRTLSCNLQPETLLGRAFMRFVELYCSHFDNTGFAVDVTSGTSLPQLKNLFLPMPRHSLASHSSR